MATYSFSVEFKYDGANYSFFVTNNTSSDLGFYPGEAGNPDIRLFKSADIRQGTYSFTVIKKTSGYMSNITLNDILFIGIGSSGGSYAYILYLNENGEPTYTRTTLGNPVNITVSDSLSKGLENITITADSGINHILYNNVTYDTFPATIPLSVDSTEMSIISKNKTSSRLGG